MAGSERRYRTIVADPPWPQKRGGPLAGREGFVDTAESLPMPYRTMPVDEIAVLGCPAAPDAHLYLWTTSGFLEAAFRVVRAWGFDYSTTLVWAKAPIGHGLGGAYGIATEFVLFARRGSLPALSKVGRNWFEWKRPYDERGKPRHSAKPPEFYAMVEQVSPGPYLEMFARDFRLGWDSWGDGAPAQTENPIDPHFGRPYHPDRVIDAEVRADAVEAERFDLSVGYPARWWVCPDCGRSHHRGHYNGAIGAHRCLQCGYVGDGGTMHINDPAEASREEGGA